ncbi:tRNA pseudouridine synthase 1 [Echria macrotheca]|uniref:tRNA pseudouridine synthase 1 n=1 Tax=Echria macrotheca TaxID=438768 RepID=A0AAJ0FAS5_9PEZI|nr:tRNA pseudouridine synthase 1 [Echria macrotheca]
MAADETPAAAPASAPEASASRTDSSEKGGDRNSGRGGARGGKRGRGRGGRGGGRTWDDNGSGKRRDFSSKRDQVQEARAEKRRRVIDEGTDGNSYMSIAFSAEEIAAEERRPKRKVAVLVGYAGTGYHGLQINHKEKTIEGDLFAAFVTTGAISKANADDPKKSSLVRCARTDKGVHAAGNVLSLKLIVEDEDIVEKINKHLPEQIRVWGIQRTPGSFSAYQACDSRWYEYLMPSYALLPPQPQSFLGKKIVDSAKEKGTYEEYLERIDDIKDFWDEVEKRDIQPILDALEPGVRADVVKALRDSADRALDDEAPPEAPAAEIENAPSAKTDGKDVTGKDIETSEAQDVAMEDAEPAMSESIQIKVEKELSPVDAAVRKIKAAYIAAKRQYRVTAVRLAKLQEALDLYLGTHNFHNYTILKSFSDASAKRHIKMFKVETTPIHIGDTEWLSIKIHGQSFMMHQIRKMIAMAVMVIRCGAPLDLITESYGPRRISIPKAPGLGLMLERPVFDEFNKKAVSLGREPVDFAEHEEKIQKFKDEHIYKRMFEVEEKENAFHLFFNQVDNFRTDYFLWVTAGGLEASHERSERTLDRVPKALEAELGDEADGVEEVGT